MIFLQQGPPDTVGYMIFGYVVIFGVMFIYLASLIMRHRNLQRDIEILEDLEDNE
jgi:hypothetical protein